MSTYSLGLRKSRMSDFRKLEVYHKSHAMMLDAHTVAEKIRGPHHFSLKNQIVRAAMSVPTNIVEGCGQRSAADYARFVRFSLNSTTELEYHMMAARDLKLVQTVDAARIIARVAEVRRMLYGLARYLDTRPVKPKRTVNPPRL